MEHYKLGKTSISMPSGWHDVPFNKGITILSQELNEVDTLALLTGRKAKEIRESTDIETIFYFANAFIFLKHWPGKVDFPLSVKMGEDRLILPWVSYSDKFDLGECTTGQVEDMMAVITMMSKEFTDGEDRELNQLELIQICPYLVAIYLQPLIDGSYDGKKAKALMERVKEELSMKEVVGMGYFFLMKLPALVSGSPSELQKARSMKRRLQRGLKNSMMRLAHMLRLI